MPEPQKKRSGVRRLLHSVKKSLKSSDKRTSHGPAVQPASRLAAGNYTAVPTAAPLPDARTQGPTFYTPPGPFHPDVIAAANRASAATPQMASPAAPTPPQPPASAPPAPTATPHRYSTQQVVPDDWKQKQAEEWARKKAEVDAIWSGGGAKKADAPAPGVNRRWTMAELKDAQDKSRYVGHQEHMNPVLRDMMRERFTKDHTIPEHVAKDNMDL